MYAQSKNYLTKIAYKMNLNLTDKIIIVTGGAKGIGLGICKVLAGEGAIPVIVGRSNADNEKAIREIEAEGGRALAVSAELTNPEACKDAVDQVVALCGRIDGLINNAGVNDGVGLESGDYEKFMSSIHKNLVLADYDLYVLRLLQFLSAFLISLPKLHEELLNLKRPHHGANKLHSS